jgi:5-methylcytosine-specific restriction endonuclease McrA
VGNRGAFWQEMCSIVRDLYLETHPHSVVRRGQRWFVKGKRPNGSTGRWDPEVKTRVVGYLWWRDDHRCGLCALPMVRLDAQIEHVVPKKLGYFDLKRTGRGRRAVAGREWRSRLHHPDNLQMAHAYCNRSKGNTPDPSKWRHPELRPLPVAENTDGAGHLWLPRRAGTGHFNDGGLPDRRETRRTSRLPEKDDPLRAKSAVSSSARQSDDELLGRLKAWRTAKARASGKPAYTVLTDRTLNELVSSRPQREEDLANVYGIGPAKLNSYGQELLDLVAGRG